MTTFYADKRKALEEIETLLAKLKTQDITLYYRELLNDFENRYGFKKIIVERIKYHIDKGEFHLEGNILSATQQEKKDAKD